MKNKILLSAFAFLTLAYTSTVYANFLTINYDAWIGHNISELTNSWGYADESFKAPNGNDVYTYIVVKKSDSFYRTIGKLKIKSNENKFCKKFFEVNNNIIVSWKMKGNYCQSLVKNRRIHPTAPPQIKLKEHQVVLPKIKSKEHQFANILGIKQVCTSFVSNSNNPIQLEVNAKGNVNSMGWTNSTLLPWVYPNGKPNNGILDFTFIANKPKLPNAQVITPIKIKYTIKNEDWIKGLVIHTSTNYLQVEKGKCSNIIE